MTTLAPIMLLLVSLFAIRAASDAQVSAADRDVVASGRLRELRAAIQRGNQRALPAFWDEVTRAGAPLVEPIDDAPGYRLVTIVWRATEPTHSASVKFWGNSQLTWTDRVRDTAMRRLLDTDLWFVSYRLRSDARVPYQIAPNDPLVRLADTPPAEQAARRAAYGADPLNPRRFEGYSVIELPDAAPQPWIHPRAGVPAGRVQSHTFTSKALGNDRPIWIYVPAAGAAAVRNLIVVVSGEDYTGAMALPTTLDNLTAANLIAPSAAVMIGGRNIGELSYSGDFGRLVAAEVVPWAARTYGFSVPPSRTVIVGSSLGGSAAAFIALRHSDVFGLALSMSGGFANRQVNDPDRMTRAPRPGELFEDGFPEGEWLTREVAHLPRLPIKFALVVGLFEDITEHWQAPAPLYAHPSLLVATRHFRDVLEAKGYAVYYREYNGAHEMLNWRGEMAPALMALFRRVPSATP